MHLRMLALLIVVALALYATYCAVPPEVRIAVRQKAKPHIVPVIAIVLIVITVAVLAYSFGAIHFA